MARVRGASIRTSTSVFIARKLRRIMRFRWTPPVRRSSCWPVPGGSAAAAAKKAFVVNRIGDFGLIGPLYAHLGRDPYPARELIAKRPALAAWVKRMQHPEQPQGGHFLPDDQVPTTLDPLFASIFGEFWPQLLATVKEVQQALPAVQPGRGFSRQLGPITIPFAGHSYRLRARPYSLWMAQRPLDALRALPPGDQQKVRVWLKTVGGVEAMQLDIQPLAKRSDNKPKAEPATAS